MRETEGPVDEPRSLAEWGSGKRDMGLARFGKKGLKISIWLRKKNVNITEGLDPTESLKSQHASPGSSLLSLSNHPSEFDKTFQEKKRTVSIPTITTIGKVKRSEHPGTTRSLPAG